MLGEILFFPSISEVCTRGVTLIVGLYMHLLVFNVQPVTSSTVYIMPYRLYNVQCLETILASLQSAAGDQ